MREARGERDEGVKGSGEVGEERVELRVVLSERMGVTAFALSRVDGGR